MRLEDYNDGNKEQIIKAKKNLVYVGILSIVMLFGGLSSAYIVSMGDTFWVKIPLPDPFWISTGIIIASSIAIQLAVFFVKREKYGPMKAAIAMTFLLGIGFVIFQMKGYGALAEKGSHFTGSGVVVTDGKYGDYFDVKQDGKFLEVDGNDYLKEGKLLSEADYNSYNEFMSQFLDLSTNESFKVKDDGRHQIYFRDQALSVMGDSLVLPDSTGLQNVDQLRLHYLAINVKDKRGHFFMRGKIGKDFNIYFKGSELGYKGGNLIFKGRKLDNYLQIKANETPDTASSYLWIITFMHLLHILVAMIFITRLLIKGLLGRINLNNNISLRMGAIFWHFLGILWLYLLLFLLFIH
jgi:cytochrome c oxidase subunit 3